MCLVHDLAEAQGILFELLVTSSLFADQRNVVGDIAPREGIPKAEKQRREAVSRYTPKAMHCHLNCTYG